MSQLFRMGRPRFGLMGEATGLMRRTCLVLALVDSRGRYARIRFTSAGRQIPAVAAANDAGVDEALWRPDAGAMAEGDEHVVPLHGAHWQAIEAALEATDGAPVAGVYLCLANMEEILLEGYDLCPA